MELLSTTTSHILRLLAKERRRVVSDWRILILACRIAREQRAPLPDERKGKELVRRMLAHRDLQSIPDLRGVYTVEVPYASVIQISDEQIIHEANPYAVFGFLTALVHHSLTDLIPQQIYAVDYAFTEPSRIPLGTTPEDWIEMLFPSAKLPRRIGAVPVDWSRTMAVMDFGHTVAYSQGIPIYVTDLERTLIDSIRMPEKSGGIATVLRAWRTASPMINAEKLAQYTDRFNKPILRQRVGYLMQELELPNPQLTEWKAHLQRGSSLKLVADAPYSPVFSADWNLSLNVPENVLQELKEDQHA